MNNSCSLTERVRLLLLLFTTYIIQWSATTFNLFALLNISINQFTSVINAFDTTNINVLVHLIFFYEIVASKLGIPFSLHAIWFFFFRGLRVRWGRGKGEWSFSGCNNILGLQIFMILGILDRQETWKARKMLPRELFWLTVVNINEEDII